MPHTASHPSCSWRATAVTAASRSQSIASRSNSRVNFARLAIDWLREAAVPASRSNSRVNFAPGVAQGTGLCPTHGVLQSPVPWATPGAKFTLLFERLAGTAASRSQSIASRAKFTLLFERLAIDWLREAAVTAVARQLQLGWDAVWGIERRAVARGLERRGTLTLRHVWVDEKSFQRRHDYVTVVSDLEGARVLFV